MRRKQPSLRGSVQQNNTVRMRPREVSRLTFLMRLGLGICAGFVVILMGAWSWHSGWLGRQGEHVWNEVLNLTQKAHFSVNDVVVEGRQHTDKDQLYVALEATSGSAIFGFMPERAVARLARLPWIEHVTIERRLPDTIYVRLKERTPLARWEHDNRVTVIDMQGKALPDADPEQFGQLPLLVGVGAPSEAKDFLEILHTFPTVERNVTAAVRVSERRWDLHLQPKIVARLPDIDTGDALKRLSILITEQKILERDIVDIDLRISDRLIIESGNINNAPAPHSGDRL